MKNKTMRYISKIATKSIGLNILSTALLAPLPSTAHAGNITWVIYDLCPVSESIKFRFFDLDNGLTWPDATNFYSTNSYGEGQKVSLGCINGAKICYGAWQLGDYWGVGEDGTKNCSDCCVLCEDVTIERRLSCPRKLLPNNNEQNFTQQPLIAPTIQNVQPPAPVQPPTLHIHYVDGLNPNGDNFLSLREGPNKKSTELYRMTSGTLLQVLEYQGDWAYVKLLEEGITGWARSKWIKCCTN